MTLNHCIPRRSKITGVCEKREQDERRPIEYCNVTERPQIGLFQAAAFADFDDEGGESY